MAQQYAFHVVDVTCEKCEARVQAALNALPGAQTVDVTRTPQDEADVIFTTDAPLPQQQIADAIQQASQGTEHHYQVRWDVAPTA